MHMAFSFLATCYTVRSGLKDLLYNSKLPVLMCSWPGARTVSWSSLQSTSTWQNLTSGVSGMIVERSALSA